MEAVDPVLLARIQFAANMTFHILFPAISIALGWVLLYCKTRFSATGAPHWMDAYPFWVKIFALTFAGWVALIAGWYVTEIGRQPWLVHGVLTAAQAASSVPTANIALTLALYVTLYAALLFAYVSVVFHLASKATIREGGADAGGIGQTGPAVGAQHA